VRIIGGEFKGRKFYPPADKWPTRPTTDFAKEGLFNILHNEIDFEDTSMLDLFGGTGNHCFEAISRGCPDATYVDKHGPCHKFVKSLAKDLSVEDKIKFIRYDVQKFIPKCTDSFDYVFAGPPYPLPWLDQIPAMFFQTDILNRDGLFVLEHNPNHDFRSFQHFVKVKTYGSTHFAFFKWQETASTT